MGSDIPFYSLKISNNFEELLAQTKPCIYGLSGDVMDYNMTICILESSSRLSLGRWSKLDKDEPIINVEKHKSLDLHPKYNGEDPQSLDIDFGCPPPSLSSFISPFVTDSIWREPTNMTNFATLGIDPERANKVYYGSDATGRPPGMLDNILDNNYTTELYDLSLNVLMSTQTERRTPIRDAIFGSSFLNN